VEYIRGGTPVDDGCDQPCSTVVWRWHVHSQYPGTHRVLMHKEPREHSEALPCASFKTACLVTMSHWLGQCQGGGCAHTWQEFSHGPWVFPWQEMGCGGNTEAGEYCLCWTSIRRGPPHIHTAGPSTLHRRIRTHGYVGIETVGAHPIEPIAVRLGSLQPMELVGHVYGSGPRGHTGTTIDACTSSIRAHARYV
jgi:hypothetical protein